jgi:hypothetical protein
MTVALTFLTAHQLRIVCRAKLFFKDRLLTDEVRSMFREDGTGMSVGLAYTDAGRESFVVRQNFEPGLPDSEIDARLSGIIVALAVSIAKVGASRNAA